MRKLLVLGAVAVGAVAMLVPSAGAVQGGTPDGNGHPYVGMSVYYDAAGVPLWRCSGTLISTTVYLTAGHCTGVDPAGVRPASAQIWFGAGPIQRGNYPFDGSSCAGYTGYPCQGDVGGTPHPNPGWTGGLTLPETHDDGVIVLDRAVTNLGTAKLAPAHYLDVLATKRGQQNVNFTVVGYGVQFERPNLEVAVKERYVGTVQLTNLGGADADRANIILSDSNGKGTGGSGTCFGDSGGPVFHTAADGTTYLVADISYGTKYCNGNSGAYRTDTDGARAFLGQYVTLP